MKRYNEIYRFFLKTVSITNYDYYNEELINIPAEGKHDFENASLDEKDLFAMLMFRNLSQEYLDGFIDFSHKTSDVTTNIFVILWQ